MVLLAFHWCARSRQHHLVGAGKLHEIMRRQTDTEFGRGQLKFFAHWPGHPRVKPGIGRPRAFIHAAHDDEIGID